MYDINMNSRSDYITEGDDMYGQEEFENLIDNGTES